MSQPFSPRLSIPPSIVAGLAAVVAGAALATVVAAGPWLWPRLLGGLFFRWNSLATAAVVPGLLVLAGSWRALARLTPERRLLGMLIGAFQVMAVRVGPLNVLNIAIMLLVLWWIIDFARTAEEPRETTALSHLLVLFAMLATLSVWGEQASPRGLIALLPKIAMAWMMLRMLRTESDVRFAASALVFTAVLSAILGIAQSAAYTLLGLEIHAMDEDSPRFIAVFGIEWLRAAGLLSNPQAYCHALSVGFMLLSFAWLGGHGRRSRWNPVVWGSLLVMAAAIMLSFARGPWAAIVLGLVVMPAVVWPRRAFHWFVALGVLMLIGVWTGALTSVLSAYRSFTLSNTEVRVELLEAAFRVLSEHPWRGVGLSNFEFYSPALERYPVHNSVMQVATEVGIPGVLAFLAILGLPLVRAVKALRTASPGSTRLLRSLLLAYLVYLIEIQGEPAGYSELLCFFVVLLDAAARIAAAGQGESPPFLCAAPMKAAT